MSRRCFAGVLCVLAVLAGTGTRTAHSQESITVVYGDGRTPETITASKMEPESEELYLRANDVARIFRATQFWNASSRKIVLGIDRTRFTLTVDTRVVVVNGEPVLLVNPILYERGFVMIPLEFVLEVASQHTPNALTWDSMTKMLRLEGVGYNVEKVTFAVTASRSTASISVKEPLLYHMDTSTPGLLRLKIYGGRIDPDKFDVREGHGLFNGVRAEQTDRDAYIYFDIKKFTSRIEVVREESPARIVVILDKGELPEIPEPEFAGKKKVGIPNKVTVSRKALRIETLVLDPGHGGKDHGKVGISGLLEKDVNLMIGRKVRELVERQLGVKVVLTREGDELVSLTRRTEIANESGGDLFISIHCNSWFSQETGGFEAYFLSPARTEWDKAVAMAENAADEYTGGVSDASSDISFILWDLVQNEYINESSHFAELIQKSMNDRLGIRDRGVKQANFTVLQGARMPAVLIEVAFLSNPEEERLLKDDRFHRRLAEGIVEAVKKLKDRYQ